MIDFNRRTKLFAKRMKQKTMCHYAFKCKSRAVVVFSQKENGRQPNDLGLCEKHAKEMLEALQILYGKKNISVSEQALIDAAEALRLADETLNRYEALINEIINDKDRKLTWGIVQDLLDEDGLEFKGVPNIRKGVDQYIAYHKPHELIAFEKAQEVVDAEAEAIDLNGEEINGDLLAQLAEAAKEEGVEFDFGPSTDVEDEEFEYDEEDGEEDAE